MRGLKVAADKALRQLAPMIMECGMTSPVILVMRMFEYLEHTKGALTRDDALERVTRIELA
jgi:hypothetical protein